MSGLEKLRSELQEVQSALRAGGTFIEVMKLTARLKEIENQLTLAEAGKPRPETPEYKPGGRATAMRKSPRDVSSSFGNGHDPLKVLLGD